MILHRSCLRFLPMPSLPDEILEENVRLLWGWDQPMRLAAGVQTTALVLCPETINVISLVPVLCFSHSLSLTHTLTLSLTLSLSCPLSHALSLSLSRSLLFSSLLSLTHALSLSSLSLSHTLPRSLLFSSLLFSLPHSSLLCNTLP